MLASNSDGQPVDGNLHGVPAGQVRGDDRQVVFERQRDKRTVVLPWPVVATLGLRDDVIGVSGSLAPGTLDVGLPFAVELLKRERGTRPLQDQLAHGGRAQRVLAGVVVNLAQKHDATLANGLHQRLGCGGDGDWRGANTGGGEQPERAKGRSESGHGRSLRRPSPTGIAGVDRHYKT